MTWFYQFKLSNEFIILSPVFQGGSSDKEPACQYRHRDMGSIPASGRSSEVGKGNWPQYSCLEDPMDREAWLAFMGSQSQTQLKELSTGTLSPDPDSTTGLQPCVI